MIILEIALYLFFIAAVFMFSEKVMWIVFFLVTFRFYESVISYEWVIQYVQMAKPIYIAVLIILAAATDSFVWYLAQVFPPIVYIFLIGMFLYVITEYRIADILFFKDYFEELGWWSSSFWLEELRELLSFSIEDIAGVMRRVWDNIVEFFQNFLGFIGDVNSDD